jgi:DNA polymerase I-like protein with 3'-5' exonuclease and polymerase domains
MTKLAIILIRDEFIKRGVLPLKDASAKLLLAIHDETLIEAKEELIEEFSNIQKHCMEKAGSYICKSLPIVASPIINNCWDHE